MFTALALHNNVLPPTINIENLDPEAPMAIASGAPAQLPEGDLAVLNNAFGFGGHDIALVVTTA